MRHYNSIRARPPGVTSASWGGYKPKAGDGQAEWKMHPGERHGREFNASKPGRQ